MKIKPSTSCRGFLIINCDILYPYGRTNNTNPPKTRRTRQETRCDFSLIGKDAPVFLVDTHHQCRRHRFAVAWNLCIASAIFKHSWWWRPRTLK